MKIFGLLKNFTFKAGNDSIKPQKSIKILGHTFQSNLKLDSEINNLARKCHNRINNIRKITHYTDFSTRLKFLNGYVIGTINYMLPIYANANQNNIGKLHKILITAARAAIGSYCFKKSITYILNNTE